MRMTNAHLTDATPSTKGADTPIRISPAVYASWRATTLGIITEALEQRLLLELMGAVSGCRLLDAGCGDGGLACAAASRGADVTGIDADQAMLAAARSRAARAGLCATFFQGRIEELPFPAASFDVVIATTVLCFVADAAGAVREMARVLRPGGQLVIGELGRWSMWSAIRRIRGWLGSRTWKSARFHSARELRALVEDAGLSVTVTRGAVYYPPIGLIANVLATADPWLGKLTWFGATFIALSATAAGDNGGK